MDFQHTSVLLSESVDFLVTDRNGVYVDCTMGGAGHSRAIAARLGSSGTLVGIDQDSDAVSVGRERLLGRFPCRVEVVRSNFSRFFDVLDGLGIGCVDGIFFDLGVSSYQLDNAERGFSYMHEGPLDMRMDRSGGLSAAEVVNTYSRERLAEIFWQYGEERWAKRIAEFIVAARRNHPLTLTSELVTVIKRAVPRGAREDGPHPAKRTFQALRIEVNNELGILDTTVRGAVDRLRSGGRIGVITFHSLEDRIVKRVFMELQKGCTCPPHLPCVCGKRPVLGKTGSVKPTPEEIGVNPRARSARLRFGVKI